MLELAVNVAANFSTVRLIVGDRLTLRQNYPDSFRLATVAPFGIDQIEAAHPDFAAFTPEYKRLLRVPFFLDLVLESQGLEHNTRREIILRYIGGLLHSQAGPEMNGNADANIAVLTTIAFEAYRAGDQLLRAKVFREQHVQLDPQRLAEAGLLRAGRIPQTFVFRHQLLHDCLAAQHFHSNQLRPDETNLNILTLKRRSAEALVFLLEGAEPERSDELITHIYDWDHSITLSCLVETRTNPDDALATVICAVLAEKPGDTFLHTRLRLQSRIWVLRRFLGIEDLSVENVLGRLRETKEHLDIPLLRSWWPVFTAEQMASVLWEALVGLDPMPGWSAAAAFRRLLVRADESVHAETLDRLTILYHALRNQMEKKDAGTLRWRVVHVMGGLPQAAPLLTAVAFDNDESEDVRYGAVRCLVELAATGDAVRARAICNDLFQRLNPETNLSPRILAAFRRCAILNEHASAEPSWWRQTYRPLLNAAWQLVDKNSDEYQLWEAQINRFDSDERSLSN